MSNITKNKNKDTIYEINKIDSLVTFEGHTYNIDDNATCRNLIYMLIDKCIDSDNLIDDYKRIVKNKEEAIRLLEKDIKEYYKDLKQSDNNLSECLDNIKAIEKEKNKIEDSIKIFFRLNEKIIK
tara:strand:- start:1138 stop:1512 length:375 start_codon:yes stop_codon:yes gene_type:complete